MTDRPTFGCWWHRWTRWVQVEVPIRTAIGDGVKRVQRRDCERCGRREEEVVGW